MSGNPGRNGLLHHIETLQARTNLLLRRLRDEEGLSTAELLGNVALAIGVLIILWGVISGRGQDLLNDMFDRASAGP